MAIIKGNNAERLSTRSFQDLGDLKRVAEEILEGARAEATAVLERARAEARAAVEEAGPRGFAEGRERGLAEGREAGSALAREQVTAEFRTELEQIAGAWREALERFETQRADLLDAAREDVLELALAMGARITRRIVDADPTVVTEHVADALALVTEPTAVTISINPEDRPLVESVLPGLVEQVGRTAHVELRDDPSVSRGGCVLHSGRGAVDATIETQIERVAAALMARTPRPRARKSGS